MINNQEICIEKNNNLMYSNLEIYFWMKINNSIKWIERNWTILFPDIKISSWTSNQVFEFDFYFHGCL